MRKLSSSHSETSPEGGVIETKFTKMTRIETRRNLILSYVNHFKYAKCRQPIWKIAFVLNLNKRTVARDINSLIEEGRLTSLKRKMGFKTIRTLSGDPTVVSDWVPEVIEFEDYKYDGYNYKIPKALPRYGKIGITTTYAGRPHRNGKAIPIDWDAWKDEGIEVATPKIAIDPHFPPFDEQDYVTNEY